MDILNIKIMKNILLIFAIISLLSYSGFSQSTVTSDIRLSAVYSAEHIADLEINQPQEVEYLNWYLDNSYKIMEVGLEKSSTMEYLKNFDPATKTIGENVEDVDQLNFNIFLYFFERQYDRSTYYRIGNTGYAIRIDSHKKLVENFKNYQNEN